MAGKAAPRVTQMSATGNRGGFTLLELLVVLVIMMMMTGIVAVSLRPALEEARLRSAARMVIASLRYARSYAISHRTMTAAVVDLDRPGLLVQARENELEGEEDWHEITTPAGRFRSLPAGIDIVYVSGTGVEQDRGEATVTFSPLGNSDSASFVLQDPGGRERTIQVDGVTGRCSLADEDQQ